MPNYKNGKLYIITSKNIPNAGYIGSTELTLERRLIVHESECRTTTKNCASFPFILAGDYRIDLIEDFPCNSKKELHRREGQVMLEMIEAYKQNLDNSLRVMNHRIPGRTRKEHYEQNKESILSVQKKAYDDDKEKYRARKRAEYAKNPEKCRARTAKNMEDPAFRERKKELASRPHTCEICGFVGTFNKRKRHQATATCKRIAEQQIAECMNDMITTLETHE